MSIRKLIFPIGLAIAVFMIAQARDPHDQQAATASQQPAPATTQSQTSSATGGRVSHSRPKPGEVPEMMIKELGNFDYDESHNAIPGDVRGLNGSVVRLRGYVIPLDQSEQITRFALVPSLFSCCYGQPPSIQHTIIVNCESGLSADSSPGEIVAEGTLSVGEVKQDDYVISLFQLRARHLQRAAH